MTRYSVNATLAVPAWIEVDADSPEQAREEARIYEVDADSPEQAREEARIYSARDYDFDIYSAEVQFNVEPVAEPVR